MKFTVIMSAAVASLVFGMSSAHAAPTSINFDDLKVACQNPARFHNQNAPKNIEISCQDSLSKYVPAAPGSVTLPVSRTVTTAMASDKYSMSATAADVKMPETIAACPKFTKIIENLSLTRQVSCEELLKFEGTATEFCLNQITELRAANPDAISVTATESVISLCEKSEEGREQRGQRGQAPVPGRNQRPVR
jgi:hypothetical protein